MGPRILHVPIVLLLAFVIAGPSSADSGLAEWVDGRGPKSPVGEEQLLAAYQEAVEKSSAIVAAAPVNVRLPARVEDFTPHDVGVRTFPTTDFSGDDGPREATTDWRVVRGTGNAAEVWLTMTNEGRLLDLGGRYVNYSDDRGKTWKSVQPTEPLVNAEGSVLQAPNGDVVAVTWDPYSGDRVITYKYDAEDETWYHMYQPLHTPFWDRPGLDVVAGDFTDPFGDEVPYLTFINGFPHDPWQYSFDGLNYPGISRRAADASSTEPIESWLDVEPDPMLDYIQPAASLDQGLIPPFAPLGDGKAWARSGNTNLMFTSADMSWHRFSTPDGPIAGNLQVDSRGWLHNVVRRSGGFDYRLSANGGRTWNVLQIDGASPGDFKANAEAGVAAVWAIVDRKDLVYKFDITGHEPKLIRRYEVGLGDDSRSGGIGFYGLSGGHRFDFSSIVVFPDGRVAVSFMDSQTTMKFPTLGTDVVAPAVAVEIETNAPWLLPSEADLAIAKTGSPDRVRTGDPLTYTLKVKNTGPDETTGVTVQDPLPDGVTFEEAAASQGSCTESDGVVTCDIGTLESGGSATVTIHVTAPPKPGAVTNTASVTSDVDDPNPSNDNDTVRTPVTRGPPDRRQA